MTIFIVVDVNNFELSRSYGSLKAVCNEMPFSYYTVWRQIKHRGYYYDGHFVIIKNKLIRSTRKNEKHEKTRD